MQADMDMRLHFLGVGNSAAARHLGSASAVLEADGQPLLMIDCGQEALDAYIDQYGFLPSALFLTHAHFDHIGGMERLFFQSYFDPPAFGKPKLFVPAHLMVVVQERLASYPNTIAEGGANFWDAFHLIPVNRGFWHAQRWFDVFPVRHHAPLSAFGIALRGSFVWTGDTRPIPEILCTYGTGQEPIFHDCAVTGNPSHTGLDDLGREYPADLQSRLVLYHYHHGDDLRRLEEKGYVVANKGQHFDLPRSEPCAGEGHG